MPLEILGCSEGSLGRFINQSSLKEQQEPPVSGIWLAGFPSTASEPLWSSLNAFVFGIQLEAPVSLSPRRVREAGFHPGSSALLTRGVGCCLSTRTEHLRNQQGSRAVGRGLARERGSSRPCSGRPQRCPDAARGGRGRALGGLSPPAEPTRVKTFPSCSGWRPGPARPAPLCHCPLLHAGQGLCN